ncbi:MAG: glycosyltransferase family 4 protein [Elusimicrobia bacterium]|nr:glycosyltransferase family 4 protein [Candidatus Liberimonas magnetica]
MKILFASHSLVEEEYRKYLKELSNLGFEIKALCPDIWKECGEDKVVKEPVEKDGYVLYPVPVIFRNHIRSFFYRNDKLVKELVRDFMPDLVHIFEEPYSISAFQLINALKILKNRPKVVIQSFENIYTRQPFPFSWIEKYNLRFADAIISVPIEGRGLWQKKGFKNKIFNLPVGIDDEVFYKKETVKEGIIKICYIGRIVKEKGIPILVEAFNKLSSKYKNIELSLIGNGYLKKELLLRNKNLSIKFIDSVSNKELPALYSKMDILVLPSLTTKNWKEQFGRVLIEAMACGVAVIGSSSGEIANVISDSGIIFKEGSQEGLSAAMEELIENPKRLEEMKAKSLERVKNNYTWAKVGIKLKNIYDEITAK